MPSLTRRQFVTRVARFGGAAAFAAMFGLELLARDRGGFKLEGRAPRGRGRRVLVLGGGPAGLATAYQLRKLGYDCSLLEARQRPGGRNWTVRGGTAETELGLPAQRCGFDAGQFFNAGAMRFSHHHRTALDYCREFGLELVPFPQFNEAAFVHVDGQPPRRIREFSADWRGHVGELLAKVIRRDALDVPLTAEDGEKLIAYLRAEGRLDASLTYPRNGDTSLDPTYLDHPRGYTVGPGNDDGPGTPTAPESLEKLLRAGYGTLHPYDHELNEQSTMLTPSGGMDRLAHAFAERLGPALLYGREVREIRRTADGGVRVVHTDAAAGGDAQTAFADFCVVTLPPHLTARLQTDFAAPTLAALRKGRGEHAGKIALQFKRRFWEEDDDIYGGRSLTTQPISQIYYPFDGFGARGKAVVIGAYHMSDPQGIFSELTLPERERLALEQGAKLHPQYPAEFDNAFSVEWHRVRYSEGAWIAWDNPADYDVMQRTLSEPDGPCYFAGDWLSPITGWQAGAFVSAHRTCARLHARATAL
ncbi:flavin monoamine oxidase family protein [Opitutus terrae]|uniref:Tryptophan 2-monooxygenase n=1 Tax=Opitutus terrae (strain DSM 11246 / JCM 15787 / PB90-1) TaxID=452637 RepID=B1ZRC6_OPITP|nr:flavin monoamine oxidase family protein [Opitutus terrae]ACB74613.1 L-amino-acid oxidase [Opitutus terrae PB90-1]